MSDAASSPPTYRTNSLVDTLAPCGHHSVDPVAHIEKRPARGGTRRNATAFQRPDHPGIKFITYIYNVYSRIAIHHIHDCSIRENKIRKSRRVHP